MMKVLVTGGAGFIGFHLASILLEQKMDVALLDNFNSFYDPRIKRQNVQDLKEYGEPTTFEADILDMESLKDVYRSFEPQAVIHLAAWAGVRPSLQNPRLYSDVNVTGTVNLLELAREQGLDCFIFGSSSSVYGGSPRVPFREDDPVDRPVSPYAATKRAGELLCHTYAHNFGMHITCLRFFTVYGPRQRPEMAIHKFARLIMEDQDVPVFGKGDSKRDYTYVDDIVLGITSALRTNPPFEIVNLGESRTTALLDLIGMLERALDRKASLKFLPEQPGDVPITYADIDHARRVLAYDPKTPIEAGIVKFAEWYLGQRRN